MTAHDIINDCQLIKEFPGGGMASVFVVQKDVGLMLLRLQKAILRKSIEDDSCAKCA